MIKKTFQRFIDNQGFLISNGLAFKTIIALAPVLLIIAGAFKIFPTFNIYKQNLINLLKDYVVPNSFNQIVSWINNVLDKTGTISIISVFIFIYLSLDLLITLDTHVEKIWRSRVKLTIIQKIFKYWALLSAFPFMLGGYFYYSGIIRSIIVLSPFVTLPHLGEFLYSFISFILLEAFFFLIYIIIPNTRVHLLKAFIVSSLVSISWIIFRIIFTYYTMMLLAKSNLLYGSFAIFIFFIVWTSATWIVLLLGLEFLCVWQNKLYDNNLKLKNYYLFEIGFILLILKELYNDFKKEGKGLTVKLIANKFHYDQKDIDEMFILLKNANLITTDNSANNYYLRRDISKIKLAEIEKIVWSRYTGSNLITAKNMNKIYEKLSKFYINHSNQTNITLNKII